ncbi:chaperone protein dnaj 1 [Quercus suber]|uniref:Chaperone protein dnaj 1 n=1 Tax=Quercus suber TaxID=58331 RepID=A0AAW0J7R4_QUESU
MGFVDGCWVCGGGSVKLSLSFSEAVKGCTKDLSFDAFVPCDSCYGRGYPPDAKTKVCPTCGGTGSVTIPPFTSRCGSCKGSGRIIKEHCMSCRGSGTVEGVKEIKVTIPAGWNTVCHVEDQGRSKVWTLEIRFVYQEPVMEDEEVNVTIPPFTSRCGSCKGSGRIIKEHCMSCRGSGTVEGVKEIKVTIPAGVDSGDTIRVPGAGNGGRGNPVFTRDGADIYVNSNISFTQAILGGTVDVPTLSGKTQLKIPKGVQPGQLLVLRGKGLPKHGFLVDHGDQYVRFRVLIYYRHNLSATSFVINMHNEPL